MMVALNSEAQGYIDRYMRQVKAALVGHSGVDAQEVERDVLGHIHSELADSEEPVTASRVRDVLDRLGSPAQWVPTEELPLWKQLLVRVRSGPEDWRLAYMTLGLFLLVIIPPIGPLFAIVSFFTARATIALVEEQGERIGARAWLLYPSLFFVYVPLLIVLLVGPAMLLIATVGDKSGEDFWRAQLPAPFEVAFAGVVLTALGVWWAIAGGLLVSSREMLRVVFKPFANNLAPRHGGRLALAGVVLIVIGAAAYYGAARLA